MSSKPTAFEAILDKYDLEPRADELAGQHGAFLYFEDELTLAAESLLALSAPYGLTVRFAAKANPHQKVVQRFDELGLSFDASSVEETHHLIDCGVDAKKISLSSQILDDDLQLWNAIVAGTKMVATTGRQLAMLGDLGVKRLAVRVNAGLGSGANNRTNVGGPSSSFGIWHEYLREEVLDVAKGKGQVIDRLHTHIGSGADSRIWRRAIRKSLDVVEQLPDVTTLDIGGGYKVARMPGEKATNMKRVTKVFAEELERFADKTGREIALEIEPGTYLVANAGVLLGRVKEKVKTPKYDFLRLNVGMNALLRPSMYGSQHPIVVLNDSSETKTYVCVGRCCESGDILTPAPNDPEGILPRELKVPEVGDVVAIGGAGAYGLNMAASNYNHATKPSERYVVNSSVASG